MGVLRDYDTALIITQLGAAANTDTPPTLRLVVPGITAPVYIGLGLPEDWYVKLQLPGINITRAALLPDMGRMLPGFVGQEISVSTPNTFNVQATPSQPVNIMYVMELAAESTSEMNALLEFIALKLPFLGYGTALSVYGHQIVYRQQGWKDMTNYDTKDGRLYRYVLTYIVEAWLVSLDCDKVPQVLTTDTTTDTTP